MSTEPKFKLGDYVRSIERGAWADRVEGRIVKIDDEMTNPEDIEFTVRVYESREAIVYGDTAEIVANKRAWHDGDRVLLWIEGTRQSINNVIRPSLDFLETYERERQEDNPEKRGAHRVHDEFVKISKAKLKLLENLEQLLTTPDKICTKCKTLVYDKTCINCRGTDLEIDLRDDR